MSIEWHKAYRRFRQFGGIRLLREYADMGLLGIILSRSFVAITHGRTMKSVYPVLSAVTVPHLRDRYRPLMLDLKDKYRDERPGVQQRRIWSCWLQGMDRAPKFVQACLASQGMCFPDREHIVVSDSTYKDYISLPEHIERKYKEGIIPPAMFSDIIRLELLIRYGGTWLDASVLCTSNDCPPNILDCDLFMFRYSRSGSKVFGGISNWFITARPNNRLLMILRDMLYQYWSDYDCVIDYYIFHHFFDMLAREYPTEIASMPYGYSPVALQLGKRLNEDYDAQWMQALVSKCCFHKTNYRDSFKAMHNSKSFCTVITRHYTLDAHERELSSRKAVHI